MASHTASTDSNPFKDLDPKKLQEILRSANFNQGILQKMRLQAEVEKEEEKKSRSASKEDRKQRSHKKQKSGKKSKRQPSEKALTSPLKMNEEKSAAPASSSEHSSKPSGKVIRKGSAGYKRT